MRIPVRPCPVALSLSLILSPTAGPDSGSASEPGPTHAERIKIIFTRFATTNSRRVEIEKLQVQKFRIDRKKVLRDEDFRAMNAKMRNIQRSANFTLR